MVHTSRSKAFLSKHHGIASLSARRLLVLQHGPSPRLQGVAIAAPIALTTNPGAGGAKSCAQRLQAKEMKGAEVVSVNMHRLEESFVEKVSDVRRRTK
jgi:hypothetical protein